MNMGKIKSLLLFILGIFLLLGELEFFGGGAHFNEYAPIVGGTILIVISIFTIVYLLRRRR